MADRLLQAGGDGDDAEQDAVVPVAEPDQREIGAVLGRGVLEGGFDLVLVAEVGPPQRCAQAQREEGRDDQPAVDRQAGGAGADDDDRLAEGDDHDQAVTLDEVRDADDEALDRRHPGREPEHRRADRPQHPLRIAAEGAADQDEDRGEDVEGSDPEYSPDLRDRGAADEHAGVEQDHDQIADPERHAAALVGIGDRQRDHEKPAHPAEQEEPEPGQVGRDRVRQPGVAVVDPPDQEQHHDDLDGRREVVAVDQHRCQLGDREDEDEVEEELELGDRDAAFGEGVHAPIMPGAAVTRPGPGWHRRRFHFRRRWRQRRQGAGVVFGVGEEVGAADLEPQGVGRPRVVAEVVGVLGRRAEAGVVDEHPHPLPLRGPGDELFREARFVASVDAPLGDRERLPLPLLAGVEAVEVVPDRILGVEVGPDPVDPAAARPVVAREVALDPRGAARQRAPDDRDRRRRQDRRRRAFGPVDRRQADFGEGRVDLFEGQPAFDDQRDPAERLLVPAGRVFAAALGPVAVDRGPRVEAAVRLAERADVGREPVFGEEVVELEQVVVAVAERDLRRGDQLLQGLVVGGRDVEDRPGRGFAPAFVGDVEAVAPGMEGLQQRRVLCHEAGEFVEVGRRAAVADPEQDARLRRDQRHRASGRREQPERGDDGNRDPARCPPGHRSSSSARLRAPPRRRCHAR